MADIDIVIEICGSAGEGTISAGEILSMHMSESGFEILSFDSYPSEIRGFGKCVAHSRISNRPIYSPGKYTDILIALNDLHAIPQLTTLGKKGIVIFDSNPPAYHEEDKSIAGWIEPGMTAYGVPLQTLSLKAMGSARGRNMVALGALSAIFGIDGEKFKASIAKRYANKKEAIIESNVSSFEAGYIFGSEEIEKVDKITFKAVKPPKAVKNRVIINGNQALAQAALDSGITLFAGYPITPATKIMEIMGKELPKQGGIMIQTEDELSAIGHVIGAGFAGKRAMTATSGPGFSLMTEMTGLAVMAEVPAVLVNSQRGGPSTGLPTKTEQSDLSLALAGGSGDSPRIVLAPQTVRECYESTCLAFYLAEKYQTLVVLLLDFFLSNSIRNIELPAPPSPEMRAANLAPSEEELKEYQRFKITESGISPRAIPGTPGAMFVATGLEHNERGKPAYDSATHHKMSEKRFRKLYGILKEVAPPLWEGPKKDVDIGVISWGSTAASAREAVSRAREQGVNAAFMSSMLLSPLHEEHFVQFSKACKAILIPELNYGGQFANYLARCLNRPVSRLNQVTGLPMPSEDILEKIISMNKTRD
jgi:2-oxoglutarate ferredoxin oxidoreductase subunit alpha